MTNLSALDAGFTFQPIQRLSALDSGSTSPPRIQRLSALDAGASPQLPASLSALDSGVITTSINGELVSGTIFGESVTISGISGEFN